MRRAGDLQHARRDVANCNLGDCVNSQQRMLDATLTGSATLLDHPTRMRVLVRAAAPILQR